MTHNYNITGMTCNACVAKAKSELLKLGDILEADVKLAAPQATITMQKPIPISVLQQALNKAGEYEITEASQAMHHSLNDKETSVVEAGSKSWFLTYKPILLIGAYITAITLLIEASRQSFAWENWMHNFMGSFFIVFSFFKMLDLKGFAEGYSTYDIVAKKWNAWGFIYPFFELGLGLAYIMQFNPLVTNGVTFVVMTVSVIGVLQSVLNNRQIKCACLGTVFNLPMSTVTIIEDVLMIAMSAGMIIKGID